MKTRAFSLIEVVIAVGLLALIGAAILSTFSSSVRVKDRVDVISNRFHLARQAMERMANEISMAYISSQSNYQNPVTETRFKGEKDRIAFDAFGHRPMIKDAKESDQREISYYLEENPSTQKSALMRKVRNNISLKVGEEGEADVLCPNVLRLGFKYWDDRSQTWSDRYEAAIRTPVQTLPQRVQIELVIKGDDDKEERFLTETEIWLTKPITLR